MQVPKECFWVNTTTYKDSGSLKKHEVISKSSISAQCFSTHAIICERPGLDVSAPDQIKVTLSEWNNKVEY